MGLDGIGAPISPVQSGPIVQPQAAPEPPENEPEVTAEEEGGGKANGVLRKLESGHFKGKGVADIRLRIAHFDNSELEPVDPEELSPVPEDGPGKAYQKFLTQYTALHDAIPLPPVEPEPDPVIVAPPEPDPVIVPPLEIEPITVSQQRDPEEPVDEGDGALAAFEELLDAQASQEEAETLDVVM